MFRFATQPGFKKRLFGFVLILCFLFIAGAVIDVFTARAQAQDTAQVKAESAGPGKTSDQHNKWAFITAAIAVAVASLGAAGAVGYVGAAAMGAMSEKPELFAKALIFVALGEGIAIIGMVVAMVILGKIIL
jgi:V/A-type H+/Na+-transporting ATPase subunit K